MWFNAVICTMPILSLFFFNILHFYWFTCFFLPCPWREVRAQSGCARLAHKPSQIDQIYILLALYETPGEFACWRAAGRKENTGGWRERALFIDNKMPSNWIDTRDSWACLICRMRSLVNLGHLWEHPVFVPLFYWQQKKDPAFSHVYECVWFRVCPTCVCCLSKKTEHRSDLIPVSHGNPHPTCIWSRRRLCNGHIYYNLHTRGHSSQEVELVYTWINLTCLRTRWKYKYEDICAHFGAY